MLSRALAPPGKARLRQRDQPAKPAFWARACERCGLAGTRTPSAAGKSSEENSLPESLVRRHNAVGRFLGEVMFLALQLIAFGLLAAYLLTAFVVSGMLLRMNRQPVPKTPRDYGLEFEPVAFRSDDGVDLKGWLIPGKEGKLVIMTHVGGLTKYGSVASYRSLSKLYDKEIEFIKTARHLHDRGYGVLMFDLRNHGESGPSPNRGMYSAGLDEYRDVVAALRFVAGREDLRQLPIGFVSFCAGANSTIIAMSKQPDAFASVKCLLLVQPISQEVFIRTYIGRLSAPAIAWLLVPAIKLLVRWRGGQPLEKMSPQPYAKDIRVPTLFVQAIHDPWTKLTDVLGMFEATPAEKELFWIERTSHRFESYSYFQEHPEKMLEWLGRRLA